MHGCEYAGPGGHLDIPAYISAAGLEGRVRLMDGKAIPYADGPFDLVISNQVFEHIPNFDEDLREIERVLADGGNFINLFPHKGRLFEVHCRAPMPHWFGADVIRAPLLLAGKRSGLGRRKKERNPVNWFGSGWPSSRRALFAGASGRLSARIVPQGSRVSRLTPSAT
ncbi:class I SAM-dependent methyltransferase [Planctomycetota bacterium]|nr:class I SAM-dependent methyltransferase [Planctomycetota bacterium]